MKTQKATTAKTTKKATKEVKVAKAPKQAAAKGSKQGKEARSGSKKEIVLKLLRREGGATLADIAKATDWQNHSIRGFVSGHVIKKLGLKVESTRSETGERTYRIVS
jgi:hypothetical protein